VRGILLKSFYGAMFYKATFPRAHARTRARTHARTRAQTNEEIISRSTYKRRTELFIGLALFLHRYKQHLFSTLFNNSFFRLSRPFSRQYE
jgi:hypothetical protein